MLVDATGITGERETASGVKEIAMADHAWVQENVDTYLAGDLTTNERDSVERHAASCEACELALADARKLERVMNGLFADARPDAAFEERMIQELARQPIAARQRPMAWRFAAGAAAVLIVGLIGAAAQALSGDSKYLFGEEEHKARARFKSEFSQLINSAKSTGEPADKSAHRNDPYANVDIDPAAVEYDTDIRYSAERIEKYSVPGAVNPNEAVGIKDGEGKKVPVNLPAPRGLGTGQGGATENFTTHTAKMKVKVHEAGYDQLDKEQRRFFEQTAKVKVLDDLKERTFYRDADVAEASKKTTKDLEGLDKLLQDKGDKAAGDKELKKLGMKPGEADPAKGLFNFPMAPVTPTLPGFSPPPLPVTTGGAGGVPSAIPPPKGTSPVTPATINPPPVLSPKAELPAPPPSDPGYFTGPKGKKGGGDEKNSPAKKDLPTVEDQVKKPGDDGKGDEKLKDKEFDKSPDVSKPGAPKLEPKVEPKQPPDEAPIETNRKIIRTGEMEFETESFDKAVDNITRLITAVKGGFIATINSDKLANGKMRGSVVVRMPPQYLDKFVFELRHELAKSGELKNQRIISLDVTKQYTDIESRLRAARTMEDRLIQIIKIGKGEIKDLVAAERELGVWRTKIEEMEGEIRYYSNQVSLSTLTITLSEKEILAPTAIVVTESVRMRLEVDDVAKSHQIAMTAVGEVKGRITRSELKQHVAGQLQSILHAEIPPAKKDEFRDKLKKLGIVSDHEENQSQRTEGGFGPAGELKPRSSDVHFDITMHNTANIRPRLTADMKIATSDVPAAYTRILDEVTKLKGQVRDGKLNEQDKHNVNAYLDFNVPTADKAAIDKVLLDVGPVLERLNVRAPVSELSTDRKFGYTLSIRDFASIAPSKSIHENIATLDVPAAYAKLQEAIVNAKGQIADAKLNEQDKLNINALIDFTVPSEEKSAFDKLIAELGTSLSRTNVQAPLNQLATGRKFGYTLQLRDFASIPASKAVMETIAAVDVPAGYAKLVEALTKAKAQIAIANLNEMDKTNVNAQLDFSVLVEEKPALDKLLVELGTSLARTNVQVALNQLSTTKKFGYMLVLRDFAGVPPTKATEMTVAASDVPVSYAKIVEAIAKAKGHVVDAKLNERDKHNISAQLTFSVPSEEKGAMDKLLADTGAVVSRNNIQAPANQLSTTKKVGYAISLRDFASIPPSKAAERKVAVADVPASFAKVQEAILKAKGHILDAKLNEQDKHNINAQFSFSVPTDKKADIDKLIDEIGTLLSGKNAQAPVTELSLDLKFGYALDLRDFATVRPSKASDLTIAASNVPGNYAKLLDAIAKAKGQIYDAKLNEKDKLNITGQIDFNVPTVEKATIEKLLEDIGSRLSRNNTQAPANELTTDRKFGYSVTIRDFANIKPRETFIVNLVMPEVPASYRDFQEAATRTKGWVNVAQLKEDNKAKIEAEFDFDVPAEKKAEIEKLISKSGAVLSRTSSQIPVNEPATDQKVGYKISLRNTASIPPREKVFVKFEVAKVDERATELKEIVLAAKGRIADSNIDRQENGQVVATLVFEVPFGSQDSLVRQMKRDDVKLVSQKSERNPQVPENELTTARIIVTLTGAQPILSNEEGVGAYVRTSLYLSFKILAIIVMTLVVGLSGIVPLVILVWVGFKLYGFMASAGPQRPILAPTGSKLIPDDDKPAEGDPTAKS